MSVELLTDKSFVAPDKRRVKLLQIPTGPMSGDHPVLWSRPIDEGKARLVIVLVDGKKGETSRTVIPNNVWELMPEGLVKW